MGKTIVVVGGGIAGISCIQALFQDYDASEPQFTHCVLISESRLVKRITSYETKGRQLETFKVVENEIDQLALEAPQGLQFKFIVGSVQRVDYNEKSLKCLANECDNTDKLCSIEFDVLCLCTGSRPRQLSYPNRGSSLDIDKRLVVIRDVNTVHQLKRKLANCRRLVIVGNGGISLELVGKITDCEKVWIVRDESIGLTFFDSGASKFLLDASRAITGGDELVGSATDRTRANYSVFRASSNHEEICQHFGPALGPDWSQDIQLKGTGKAQKLEIIYNDELEDISYSNDRPYPLEVSTKHGKQFQCDLIISAIGVLPNQLEFVGEKPSTSRTDEGILVDTQMRTSLRSVYAAGDVVSCDNWPPNELWFQMRLWTQARQMGYYAGRCIVAHIRQEDPLIYSTFDCFTHCTTFFGHKLILLGRFNGQSVAEKFEVMVRVNPGKDYVKILVKDDGRIMGAVLVGDSGLEETLENLMLDKIDISTMKEQLLDNTVDIEDYFD